MFHVKHSSMEENSMSAGIDYGRGQVKVDHNTGIRYGVIHSQELGQAWYDSCESDYGEPSCPDCGGAVVEYDPDKHDTYRGFNGWKYCKWLCCADYACESCTVVYWEGMIYPESPIAWTLEDSEYTMQQSGDDCDIFITIC